MEIINEEPTVTKKKFTNGDLFQYYTGELLVLETFQKKEYLHKYDEKLDHWTPWIDGKLVKQLIDGALLIYIAD